MTQAPDGTWYDLSGPNEAPVVAMIHGLGLCSDMFEGFLPTPRGYRLLRYDLYGHGQSAPSPFRAASLGDYATQLAGVLDHAGVAKAHVLGFSIGGMINRRFAMDYHGRAASLMILNSPHDRGTDLQEEVEARALQVRAQGAMSTMDAALKRWFTAGYLEHGTGAQRVQDWRARVDAESYAQAAWVLANGVRELIRPDPPINLPTLVMTCENDSGSTPAMSREIAREIGGSVLEIIPELKHLGLMEEPDLFAAPLGDFLQQST